MSWGAWILVLVYPVNLLLILANLRQGYPRLAEYLRHVAFGTKLLDITERFRRFIAWWTIPLGIGLGIYTGILLSAFMARPFWNTGLLGPLFLVSGLSMAAALAVLAAKQPQERHWFTKLDLGLILVELVIVAMLLISLLSRTQVQLEAARLIFGGSFTIAFWLFFVGLALLAPLVLEFWKLRGRAAPLLLAPVLVLVGGFVLRQVTLDMGQSSEWVRHQNQYSPQLLERLWDE
jgi:formate-dependent nitrite reductase membrane component NrfD